MGGRHVTYTDLDGKSIAVRRLDNGWLVRGKFCGVERLLVFTDKDELSWQLRLWMDATKN